MKERQLSKRLHKNEKHTLRSCTLQVLMSTSRPSHSGWGSHRALGVTSWGIRPGKGGFPSARTSAQPGCGPPAHTEPHAAPTEGRGGRGLDFSPGSTFPPTGGNKGVSPRPGCFPELCRGGRCVGRTAWPPGPPGRQLMTSCGMLILARSAVGAETRKTPECPSVQ